MMEKLIAGMADILECEAAELSGDTVFREHEDWDSLAALSTITMIDEEFDVVIPQAEFRNLLTINDIAKFVESKNA
jgi:acyl carrier protein